MKNLAIATALLALAASGAAQAADIPVKAPVLREVVPVFSWQGCHIGVSGGATFGRSRHDGNPPGPIELTPYFNISGGMVGVGYGCTYVLSPGWAFGTDSDLSWTNKRGSSFDTGPGGNPTFNSQTNEHWFSTTRLRVGPTWDRLWVYATGGLATASVEGVLTVPGLGTFGETHMLWGATGGAGLEYALSDMWSFKVEYLYARFQNKAYTFGDNPVLGPAGLNSWRSGLNVDDHVFRVGLNYRFGCIFFCGPVVARY